MPDCTENATYVPGKELLNVKHQVSDHTIYIDIYLHMIYIYIYISYSIIGERVIFHQRPNAHTARKPVGHRNVWQVCIEMSSINISIYLYLSVHCLYTGYRCEWCGMTTHAGCRMYLPTECNFGILQPIYLPPHSVSIPRTEVPIEAIIGVQVKSKTSLVRDYSCRKYTKPYPTYPHLLHLTQLTPTARKKS